MFEGVKIGEEGDCDCRSNPQFFSFFVKINGKGISSDYFDRTHGKPNCQIF